MRLIRIRIQQYRRFSGVLEIRDLQPGLNLFSGPNESGKSTIVHAIRSAFFEHHRLTSFDGLQPRGDSSAAPAVEIGFEWQGEHWQLAKRFLRQRRCDLEIAGRQYSGEEAEARLAGLLGFQHAGRGGSKAEHWGIPGLLWVEQGSGQDIVTAVAHAGNYLKSALGASLGELASSSGDQLLAQVQARRARLLTATGKPTGEYAAGIARLGELEEALNELDTKILQYRQQVDLLGELRLQQQADAQKPWEELYRQARQAQASLDETAAWSHDHQRQKQELQSCQQAQQLCSDQLAGFARQEQELQQRQEKFRQASQELDDLQAGSGQAGQQLQQARAAWQSADSALRQARQREQHASLQRELQQLEQQLADTGKRLDQARTRQAALHEQQAALQKNRVDAAAHKKLQQLSDELDRLRIIQQAIAGRLAYRLEPGQQLQLDGQAVSGTGEHLFLESLAIDIPGVGSLRIEPGGENTAQAARRLQEADNNLQDYLRELGQADIAQAMDAARSHQDLLKELEIGERQLSILAPTGMGALEQQHSQLQQRAGAIRARLNPDQGGCTYRHYGAEESAREQLAQAESAQDIAREQLEEAEKRAHKSTLDLGLARQARDAAREELQNLQAMLDDPARTQRRYELQQQLVQHQARGQELEASIQQLQLRINAARPDILQQDVERLQRSAQTMQEAAGQRERELLRLQAELELIGAHGLEEQRAALEPELDHSRRRHDELARRAAALDLLQTMLAEKRQALARRIQAPLQRHLKHYLQLLFPGASLQVDENLIPELLIRPQHAGHEAYMDLSFGAREQMGLISRLAYADLLQEAGRPTLLLLDDILVHSDGQRLSHMKRILFDAARRHQVLLFTCHPHNWQDLGVPARDIRSLVTAVS